jgi:hypothetical protein
MQLITTDIDADPFNTGERYLPTPAVIRAECRAIQSTWTRDEELRRRVIPPSRPVDYGRVARFGE